MTTQIGWRDHLVGLGLAVAYVRLLLVTSRDLAMSRDESFYVVAAERYGGWIERALTGEGAFEQAAIDQAWSYNHEHPALAKSLYAISWLAHRELDLFPMESMAHRFPAMVIAGLLLWLIWIFGARAYGRSAGAFAALAFALLPRPFYHAHLNAFDVPITFFLLLVTYLYWRSLDKPWWAIAAGAAYGLALATKHNAWILPGVLLIHWIWTIVGEVRARRRGQGRKVSLVPWWLIAMIALGPAIFVGSWPWLWSDTAERFREYAAFHLDHEYYNMEYFGVNYFWPPFPSSYAWVMTLFTVPLTTLALGIAGLALRARALLPPGLETRIWKQGKVEADRLRTDVLLVGSLLAPLVVISLPSTPIFGGTKHWFPAYPFLVIFAGIAFARVARIAREAIEPRLPQGRGAVRAVVAAVLLAPAAVDTVHSHPFGLSHYGFAAGGVPGAADYGMNRQFWGFTTGSLVDWLNAQMPEGGTVWICDTTFGAWEMLQRDGRLAPEIRATPSLPGADYVLVHHEKHFDEVDMQAWVAFGSVQPAYVLTHDGVPIITVYESPRHRALRQRRERAQGPASGTNRGPVR